MKAATLKLTASQLKWLALTFMTIDHLAQLAEIIPVMAPYAPIMKTLGRIAAPLFLFILTESVRYTKSKPRFILRLYIAGVSCEAITILMNLAFSEILITTPENIFFTYFYTSVYIYLVENLIKAGRERRIKSIIVLSVGFISTFIPQMLFWWFDSIQVYVDGIKTKILLRELLTGILPPTFYVEYSLLFVFMGVLLYFVKERRYQYIVFSCFCAVSFAGSFITGDLWPFNDFFDFEQYWMILALPIMLFYNGEEGTPHKLFFYVYYPVHRYIISFLAALIRA